MPKKKTRMTVYAIVAVGLLALAGVEGATAEQTSDWVALAGQLAGALGAVLALANPKEDQTTK